MTLTGLLYHLLGFTNRWSVRAEGMTVALLAPVLVLAIVDWRMRRHR